MAARWLERLQNKQKRMKRAYLQTKAGSGQVNVPKIMAYEIYQNKNRVRTTTGSGPDTEPKLDHTFNRDIPRTLWEYYIRKRGGSNARWDETDLEFVKFVSGFRVTHPLATDRKVWLAWLSHPMDDLNKIKQKEQQEREKRVRRTFLVDTLHEVWQGRGLQGVRAYNETILRVAKDFKLVLYFSGNEWVFVMTSKGRRFISETYQGRQDAMACYHNYFGNGQGRGINWIIDEPVTDQ